MNIKNTYQNKEKLKEYARNRYYSNNGRRHIIIKNLDPAKAHGCDNIPIKMIKICSES